MLTSLNRTVESFETREQWLAARRTGIGSSDAAAIVGEHPWLTPIEVYASKTDPNYAGKPDSEAMFWGRTLEGIIGRVACERNQWIPSGVTGNVIYRRADKPHLIATPDNIVVDWGRMSEGCVEVKHSNQFNESQWRSGVPRHYYIQLQHQLAVTGCEWGAIVCLLGNTQLLVNVFDRCDETISRIEDAIDVFWDYVQRREPPLHMEPLTLDAVNALYPAETPGKKITLPDFVDDLDAELADVKAKIKSLEERKKAIETEIKAAMGDAAVGVLSSGDYWSWITSERKGYTVEPSTVRQFLRKKRGKGE